MRRWRALTVPAAVQGEHGTVGRRRSAHRDRLAGNVAADDTLMRFEPDGEATRLTVESDYEMPRMLPGFIKDLAKKGWMNRRMDQMLGDFKALAEATVPVPA